MRIIFRILLTYMQICIKISIMTDSKEMIKKLGLTPNKALGQNFLIDTEAISRIARDLCRRQQYRVSIRCFLFFLKKARLTSAAAAHGYSHGGSLF